MTVYRHVQRTSASIKDGAVTSQRVAWLIQTGTGSPPAVAAYVSFTTSYGTPPMMDVRVIGPAGAAYGSATASKMPQLDLVRIRTGSFQWSGTPLSRARWRAWGLSDLSSA